MLDVYHVISPSTLPNNITFASPPQTTLLCMYSIMHGALVLPSEYDHDHLQMVFCFQSSNLFVLINTCCFTDVARYHDFQLGPINALSFAFVEEFDYG